MTRHRLACLTAAAVSFLLTLSLVSAVGTGPATAASTDQLSLTLDSLSPARLVEGERVRLSGTISNPTGRRWTELKVYLVMPVAPLTDRADIAEALDSPSATQTGERLTDLSTIARADDLEPGGSSTFTLDVPYRKLGISGADGVYPIGAQVLATPDGGARGQEAVGRAYTAIPLVSADSIQRKSRVSVVWPFTTLLQRRVDGTYVGTSSLLESIGPEGRLRRLLDLARSDESSPATVLLDPALLTTLDAIAQDSYGPEPLGSSDGGGAPETPSTENTEQGGDTAKQGEDDEARTLAREFLEELLTFARRHTIWAVSYGQPDVLGLTRKVVRDEGSTVITGARAATSATLDKYDLDARIVDWPPNGIAPARSVKRSRRLSAEASLVSSTVLKGWQPTEGTFVTATVGGTPTHLVVIDPTLTAAEPDDAALDLRQRIVSDAALRTLSGEGSVSPDVGVVVDPSFDPGERWRQANFYDVFDVPWVTPSNADDRLMSPRDVRNGRISLPDGVQTTPISAEQVRAAASLLRESRMLQSILSDGKATEERTTYAEQAAALATSQAWRSARTTGAQHANTQAEALDEQLARVSIDAPPTVTLPGSSGRFPLTVANDLDETVTVGVRLHSDNQLLEVSEVDPISIEPGQSVTVTITANVGEVTNTVVTATAVTPDGQAFGDPTSFTLRSSVVGTIIWVGIGLASLLVVAAFVRRFVKRRRERNRLSPVLVSDDEDD